MLNAVMTEIKNHFAISAECVPVTFDVDGIRGNFRYGYLVGQYVWVKNSTVNDGVYQIVGIEGSKMTLDGTFGIINADISLFGLSVPKEFLELVDKISTLSNTETVGLKSESLGDYSASYKDGSEWESTFRTKLNKYRRMFDCDERRF